MNYEDFIASKAFEVPSVGIAPGPVHESLFDFQRAIVEWALRRGRAAVFAGTGLGKTRMQIDWARQAKGGGRGLIVAPLGVVGQTIEEAAKLGVEIVQASEPNDAPLQITNYQKLHKFVGADYHAIALDESSILKSIDGKTRTMLLREFTNIPHRLCCTATPAPNDVSELANHAEFLGVMSRVEMLAAFFVHESSGKDAGGNGWTLKGHGQEIFWRWVAKWAVYLRSPDDLGFDGSGFVLPPLHTIEHVLDVNKPLPGKLFAEPAKTLNDRRRARKVSMDRRIEKAKELIDASDEQWLVWVGLNDEGKAIVEALGDSAVNIEGASTDEERLEAERRWRVGELKTLSTKGAMFSHGMNWQHCHNMIFLGLDDSWERFFQAIRRCWRFGQKHAVNAHIIVGDGESLVLENINRKEEEAQRMVAGVVAASRESQMEELNGKTEPPEVYKEADAFGDGWRALLGDCVKRVKDIDDASIGLSIHSPPFAQLFVYNSSPRDLGNSKNYDEFFAHYLYLLPELMRVTMPGRRACVHVQQVTTTKATHGVIGWRDFRADVRAAYEKAGWVYDGEVVIDKDPQAQAIRTKSKQLMFVQKERDASWLRPAMADYILLFRHPGENTVPVKSDVTNEEWILWARPIWYGIRESDTLNVLTAREDKDLRHVCPLQLETIRRCIRLWSNKGEWIYDPFGGIGSTVYEALRNERKGVMTELKEQYWKTAQMHINNARSQRSIFDLLPEASNQ